MKILLIIFVLVFLWSLKTARFTSKGRSFRPTTWMKIKYCGLMSVVITLVVVLPLLGLISLL